MTIYEHRATVTASAGQTSTTTLAIQGGICRHLLIRANTDSTIFRADLVDPNSVTIRNWGFHEGEVQDFDLQLPLAGENQLNITNASADDTFTVLLQVEE